MKCPVCGDDIPAKKAFCPRCGYICKSIVLAAEKEDDENEEVTEGKDTEKDVKEIDPSSIYMSGVNRSSGNGGGGLFGNMFGGGLFGSIFDSLFGDPFADFFGDYGYEEEEDPEEEDFEGFKGGVYHCDTIEIDEVETIIEDNPKDNKDNKN